MAEPYSDEQLELWNASTPVQMGSLLNERWLATANRLQRERDDARRDALANLKGMMVALNERDKARRVAQVLLGPAKHLKVLGHDLTADELKAIDTALAYPEAK
jgi:hypothetical protein